MGFLDSMKGFVGGIGNIVSGVIGSPIGQQFLGAGLSLGFEKLFGRPAFPVAFNPGGFPLPTPRQRLPALPPRLPPRMAPPLAPFTRRAFEPAPLSVIGGLPMPHAPSDRFSVTEAAFGFGGNGGLGAQNALFDIPGVDLRLPFTADARTGGTEFFHGVGAVSQRPRKLIMQLNPSSGNPTFFRHAGRPIMFSGDRAICRGVEKIARRHSRRRSRS